MVTVANFVRVSNFVGSVVVGEIIANWCWEYILLCWATCKLNRHVRVNEKQTQN